MGSFTRRPTVSGRQKVPVGEWALGFHPPITEHTPPPAPWRVRKTLQEGREASQGTRAACPDREALGDRLLCRHGCATAMIAIKRHEVQSAHHDGLHPHKLSCRRVLCVIVYCV
jgi:hypothetical protein